MSRRIKVEIPKKCAGCGEKGSLFVFGQPYFYTLEDSESSSEFDASQVVGWICDGWLTGTVVASRRKETGEWVDAESTGHTFQYSERPSPIDGYKDHPIEGRKLHHWGLATENGFVFDWI